LGRIAKPIQLTGVEERTRLSAGDSAFQRNRYIYNTNCSICLYVRHFLAKKASSICIVQMDFRYIEERRVESGEEEKAAHKLLVSDPIMCQAPGGSVLSFR
jgi:hypothetical protein